MAAVSERFTSALVLAATAHDGQPYGDDPYIWHPLAVARSLYEKGYDEDTVIAGLLHDVPEDTNVTAAQIAAEFGARVGDIVHSMDKTGSADEASYIHGLIFDAVPVKLIDSLKNFLGLGSMKAGPRKDKLTNRYLRNIATLSNRLEYEGRMPKLTKPERLALKLALAHDPQGWGETA